MWQARMENNSADTDGRCSSGQDTRVYASYAREYGSKQRTTAVTGASVLCFWPRRGIRMNSWKEFLRRLVTAEFLPPEAISNYSTYRYTRDTPTSSSSRRKRKEKKTREEATKKWESRSIFVIFSDVEKRSSRSFHLARKADSSELILQY